MDNDSADCHVVWQVIPGPWADMTTGKARLATVVNVILTGGTPDGWW